VPLGILELLGILFVYALLRLSLTLDGIAGIGTLAALLLRDLDLARFGLHGSSSFGSAHPSPKQGRQSDDRVAIVPADGTGPSRGPSGAVRGDRMRRFSVVAVASTACVMFAPTVAHAGGSVLTFDRFVLVGQTVTARGTFGACCGDPVRAGPWYAYLRPENGHADGAMLGTVSVRRREHGEWSASVSFVVPPVATNRYLVSVCDLGCRHQPGDLVGGWTVVARLASEAHLFLQAEASDARADALRRDIRKQRRKYEELQDELELQTSKMAIQAAGTRTLADGSSRRHRPPRARTTCGLPVSAR
jgi:hypothetical protein